jgi:hypothetical protein
LAQHELMVAGGLALGGWLAARDARERGPEGGPASVQLGVIVVPSVITIGIDPYIEAGPVSLAWHGLMIAVGILVGGLAAAYDARRRGLEPERMYAIGLILVAGELVGGRASTCSSTAGLTIRVRGSPPLGSPSTAASSRPPSASPPTSGARG